MKAVELRIGNWYRNVKFNVDVQCTLEDFYELCAQSDGATDHPPIDKMFSPIPITPEWIERFGFRCENGYGFLSSLEKIPHYKRDGVLIVFSGSSYDYCRDDIYDGGTGTMLMDVKEIKYVHRLQNLYFELKDKELTIKK